MYNVNVVTRSLFNKVNIYKVMNYVYSIRTLSSISVPSFTFVIGQPHGFTCSNTFIFQQMTEFSLSSRKPHH